MTHEHLTAWEFYSTLFILVFWAFSAIMAAIGFNAQQRDIREQGERDD